MCVIKSSAQGSSSQSSPWSSVSAFPEQATAKGFPLTYQNDMTSALQSKALF